MDQEPIKPQGGTTFVPAICTQCGAHLEVDPTQEAAVCQYCGTPFIVQKAISNYNIQNATIEHADTVNVHVNSTADSFFGFVGKQMSESRQIRHEEKQAEREYNNAMTKNFFKVFIILFVIMIVVFFVGRLLGVFDDGDESIDTMTESAVEAVDSDYDSSFENDPFFNDSKS